MYAFGAMLSFTIAHLSVIRLRIKEPDRPRPYRGPGTLRVAGRPLPLFALFGIFGTGLAFVTVTLLHLDVAAAGVAWLVLGMALYVIYRRRHGLDLRTTTRAPRPERPADFEELQYKTALVPIFGNDVSASALSGAAKLIGEEGIVYAIYVLPVPSQLSLEAGLEEEEAQGRSVLESARIQARRRGIKIHTGLIRTRNPGAALVQEAERVGSDVIYWSAIHAPAGEQRIGPTAVYLLSKRPCRVIIETDNRPPPVQAARGGIGLSAAGASRGTIRPANAGSTIMSGDDRHRALAPAAEVRPAVASCRRPRGDRQRGRGDARDLPVEACDPVLSLGILYVLPVVAVSMFWGLSFGIATSVLSAAAFNFFHLPPGGHFTLADDREWVALLTLVLVATATGLLAELARTRGREAEQRRQEADLSAEMAQLLLGAADLESALEAAAPRLAAAVGAASAALSRCELDDDAQWLAFPLRTSRQAHRHAASPAARSPGPSGPGSPIVWSRRWSRSSLPRCTAPSSRPRSWRRAPCDAATSSRQRCCARCPTISARR